MVARCKDQIGLNSYRFQTVKFAVSANKNGTFLKIRVPEEDRGETRHPQCWPIWKFGC